MLFLLFSKLLILETLKVYVFFLYLECAKLTPLWVVALASPCFWNAPTADVYTLVLSHFVQMHHLLKTTFGCLIPLKYSLILL